MPANPSSYSRFDERYVGPNKIIGTYNTNSPQSVDPNFFSNYQQEQKTLQEQLKNEIYFGNKSLGEAANKSYLGSLGFYFGRNQPPPVSTWGAKPQDVQNVKNWYSNQLNNIQKAADYEKQVQAKQAQAEKLYDTTYAQTERAKELAGTGGILSNASEVAKQITGGAGMEKEGQFKNIYGVGSIGIASWMKNKLDPTKFAKETSGIEDRSKSYEINWDWTSGTPGLTRKQQVASDKLYESGLRATNQYSESDIRDKLDERHKGIVSVPIERSKFVGPTKTGLGKYATTVF